MVRFHLRLGIPIADLALKPEDRHLAAKQKNPLNQQLHNNLLSLIPLFLKAFV
ncbi:hypothetical protein ACT691_13580 [Vibrio metschnikovii]